jgi:ABC-2 type transport system permease protein
MSLKRLVSYARVVGMTFVMTLRQNFTDAFILFAILFQPMIIAVLAMWMLRERAGDFAIFVIIGSGMTGLWSSLLFVSGNSITSERWMGTLEMLVGSPVPLEVIVFGKNLANVTQSLISMIFSYLLVALFFDISLSVAQPFLFTVSLVITVVSFVFFGLIMSSLFILSPDVQRWQNGLEFPIYILSGFLFPVALLPGWTTPVSYLLTPYWAAQALHYTTSGGGSFGQIAFAWGMMILFSLVWIFVASRLFRYILHKARVEATLGLQ